MTTVLPKGETKVAKIKQKLTNDVHAKEETRSFLRFSRENLNISHTKLEQGFNKHRRSRPNRNTILSVAALVIAFLCLGLEMWKLRCSLVNAREIQELKRDVDSLKYRFLEEDLLDELRAFEEQLYKGDSNDDGSGDGEMDIDNTEYDADDYAEDDNSSSHDYLLDYHTPSMYRARPSDIPDSSSKIAPIPTPPKPSSDKAMMELLELLEAVRETVARHRQELKKNVRENHKNVEKEQHLEEHAKVVTEDKIEAQKNNTKQKRDVPSADNSRDRLSEWRAFFKRKRSIGEHKHGSRKLIASGSSSRESSEDKTVGDKHDTSVDGRGRHPPKKYYTHSVLDDIRGSLVADGSDSESRSAERQSRKSPRRLRKNLHGSKQILAAHYGADKHLVGRRRNDTGGSRVRHEDRVFKAWRASDWVEGLRMDQHFDMKDNGSLVISKDGLYLVYAQIHYMDEHFEAGFHLEVNNRPIFQCMNYNSGRDKDFSQSCFSAQVTRLNKNDILVLKEVGSSSRYALLEAEKSFLGLVRLGDVKTLPFFTSQ